MSKAPSMNLPIKTHGVVLFFLSVTSGIQASEHVLSPIIKTKVIKKSPVVVRKNKHQEAHHFSIEITPPNSPIYLARAQITHDQKDSCSIKVFTRPHATILNILADQLQSKKIDSSKSHRISVELYNLKNDKNSELNKFVVNFFKSKLSPAPCISSSSTL